MAVVHVENVDQVDDEILGVGQLGRVGGEGIGDDVGQSEMRDHVRALASDAVNNLEALHLQEEVARRRVANQRRELLEQLVREDELLGSLGAADGGGDGLRAEAAGGEVVVAGVVHRKRQLGEVREEGNEELVGDEVLEHGDLCEVMEQVEGGAAGQRAASLLPHGKLQDAVGEDPGPDEAKQVKVVVAEEIVELAFGVVEGVLHKPQEAVERSGFVVFVVIDARRSRRSERKEFLSLTRSRGGGRTITIIVIVIVVVNVIIFVAIITVVVRRCHRHGFLALGGKLAGCADGSIDQKVQVSANNGLDLVRGKEREIAGVSKKCFRCCNSVGPGKGGEMLERELIRAVGAHFLFSFVFLLSERKRESENKENNN